MLFDNAQLGPLNAELCLARNSRIQKGQWHSGAGHRAWPKGRQPSDENSSGNLLDPHPHVWTRARADFGEGDATKHFSVEKKGFSVKRGAIQ